MMKKIKTGTTCIFVFITSFLFSQYDQDRDPDKKYTPNKNSIFNNLLTKNTEPGSSGTTEIRNVIKFCPTLLLRQKVALFYERDIASAFSINFGIGKAFGNDYLQYLYLSAFSDFNTGSTLAAGQVMDNSEYTGSKPMLHVGFKIFFSGTTFEDGYVEFNYRRETMDYTLNSNVGGYRVEKGNLASFKMNAFSFGFGYMDVSGVRNNITHEFFMNFGIKNFSFTSFVAYDKLNTWGQTERVYERTHLESQARILPSFNMGYIFGFGF
jgi:hypothetical protein